MTGGADAYTRYLPKGYSRRKVRDFMRDIGPGHIERKYIVKWFGADITDELLAKKWIRVAREKHYVRDGVVRYGKIIPGRYMLAERGWRFSAKSLIKPLPRKAAKPLIAELIERARTINRTPDFLFYVRQISVFGSYLDKTASELGDIDIAVWFSDKRDDYGGDYEKFKQLVIARAHAKAPFRNFAPLDEYDFVKHEAYKFLKNRNRYLQILTSPMNHIQPQRILFSERRAGRKERRP